MKSIAKILRNKTLYGTLMVFIIWYILYLSINSPIIPSPYGTVKEFIKSLRGLLALHLLASSIRIVFAVIISLVVGVPLGLWVGRNNTADAIISPIVYILYPLPKIAFLPIFMILFGIGDLSKIILIISIIVFQILIAARDGVKEIPKELFFSVSSMGVGKIGIYRHLILPAVLPKLLTGLRISVGISISALFFSENFATSYGIGYYIMNAWTMVNYKDMFVGILALSILGMVFFKGLDLLEKKVCPWIYVEKK
ncbi:ABC transporter permease [Sporosalibacterium faouarense]|uniref:ABC transporter permease n=1 Tax=Sporosalibacterium faouarense TaxID=516123 RepID=UPI00192BD7F4|nr:ABC transporter permease [Sporosalibacterium faouarense]